jgi:bacteriocin-like protein
MPQDQSLARATIQRTAAIMQGGYMSDQSIETPKADSKPDDLIKPKTKDGKTELTELSEEEMKKVSGGSGWNVSKNADAQ